MHQQLQRALTQRQALQQAYSKLTATHDDIPKRKSQLTTAGRRLQTQLQEPDTAKAAAAQESSHLSKTSQQVQSRAAQLQQLGQLQITMQHPVTGATPNQCEQRAARLQQQLFEQLQNIAMSAT